MKRSFIFMLVFFLASGISGPVIADPLSLDETIDEIIKLFETEDYAAFVTQYSHPDVIAKMTASGMDAQQAVDKLIAAQERFGGMTLKLLKEAKGMQPHYENDGRDAWFDFKGGYFLHFRQDDSGKWCMM